MSRRGAREHVNSFQMDPILMMQNCRMLFQNKYNDALEIFNQIINKYPDSENDGVLKSGFSHQVRKSFGCRVIFQRVIRDYPNSSASSLAED